MRISKQSMKRALVGAMASGALCAMSLTASAFPFFGGNASPPPGDGPSSGTVLNNTFDPIFQKFDFEDTPGTGVSITLFDGGVEMLGTADPADADSIVVSGIVYSGADSGGVFDPANAGFWALEMTWDGVEYFPNGDVNPFFGVKSDDLSASMTGTIRYLSDAQVPTEGSDFIASLPAELQPDLDFTTTVNESLGCESLIDPDDCTFDISSDPSLFAGPDPILDSLGKMGMEFMFLMAFEGVGPFPTIADLPEDNPQTSGVYVHNACADILADPDNPTECDEYGTSLTPVALTEDVGSKFAARLNAGVPVPEPGTLGLLALALVATGFARRRSLPV